MVILDPALQNGLLDVAGSLAVALGGVATFVLASSCHRIHRRRTPSRMANAPATASPLQTLRAALLEVRVLGGGVDAVYDVGGKGRSGDLHRFRRQLGDVVEEPLAPAEEHRDDVEH